MAARSLGLVGHERISFGQKESPGWLPELFMDLSECTVSRKAYWAQLLFSDNLTIGFNGKGVLWSSPGTCSRSRSQALKNSYMREYTYTGILHWYFPLYITAIYAIGYFRNIGTDTRQLFSYQWFMPCNRICACCLGGNLGTTGVLFLVLTMKCKNTSANCLGTCGCEMNLYLWVLSTRNVMNLEKHSQ